MKKSTKIAVIALTIACASAISAKSAFAFEKHPANIGENIRKNHQETKILKPIPNTGNRIVPPEIQERFREELKETLNNMPKEEKIEYKTEMPKNHQEIKAEKHTTLLEDFSGLSREELRNARKEGKTIEEILTKQGKTKEEAEEFLTQRFTEKAEQITENHNLSEAEKQTLLDRIAKLVQNIVNRWFNL